MYDVLYVFLTAFNIVTGWRSYACIHESRPSYLIIHRDFGQRTVDLYCSLLVNQLVGYVSLVVQNGFCMYCTCAWSDYLMHFTQLDDNVMQRLVSGQIHFSLIAFRLLGSDKVLERTINARDCIGILYTIHMYGYSYSALHVYVVLGTVIVTRQDTVQ